MGKIYDNILQCVGHTPTVRLNHVNVDVRDEAVSPTFHDRFTMNLRASDLGAPGRPATLDLELYSGSMLEALRVRGETDLRGDSFVASLTFGVYGLRLKDSQAYLASLGVQTSELPVSLTGVADVSLSLVPGRPGVMDGSACQAATVRTATPRWAANPSFVMRSADCRATASRPRHV